MGKEKKKRFSFLRSKKPKQTTLSNLLDLSKAEPKETKEEKRKDIDTSKYFLVPKKGVVAVVFIVLVFSGITGYQGFEKVDEIKTKVEETEVVVNEPIAYSVSDSAVSGLSATGAFVVRHDVVVQNTDSVDSDFVVHSTIEKDGKKSKLSTAKNIAAGTTYTFNIMHNRAWDNFDASYEIVAGNKTGKELKEATIEYTVKKTVWSWPW